VLYQLTTGITDVVAEGAKGALPDAGNVRADYVNTLDASSGVIFSVRTFGHDSSLTLGKGWDQTTGLGTPSGGSSQPSPEPRRGHDGHRRRGGRTCAWPPRRLSGDSTADFGK